MPSPLITGSLNRPTTAGRIVNIQSFLPIKPVKHKPTKEEIQAKKEEDLRIKKEKEESARSIKFLFSRDYFQNLNSKCKERHCQLSNDASKNSSTFY